MTTFAHVETGFALDPQPAPDEQSYRNYFRPAAPQPGDIDITKGWNVQQVPDGTQQGAASDGQGGWVNPPPPVHAQPQPIQMTGVAFHDYCATVLATVNNTSATQGMARLGDILKSLQAAGAANGGLLMIAWVRYSAAGVKGGTYSFTDVQTLMAALQTAAIVQPPEAAAIVANWPRA